MQKNPKVLGSAGFGLFMLGLVSVALVYARGDASPETLRLVLGAAVLLPLGVSSICLAALGRLEKRVEVLEGRER